MSQVCALDINGDMSEFHEACKQAREGEAPLPEGERLIVVRRADVELALSDYPAALERIVLPRFENYLPECENSCRLFSRTREAYAKFLDAQRSAALLFRVAVGGPDHEGLAPAEARERMVRNGRVPLDPVVVASMVRTHHRLEYLTWLDTLGAEVSPKGDGRFDDTPYFDCRQDRIVLDWNWATRARSFRLAVSAASP